MAFTLENVRNARAVIAPFIQRTPLLSSRALGERIGATAYLKAESLQCTGSFKARGAAYAVSLLDAAQRAKGVVTMSAGNAGQAVAWAARAANVPAVVVMPESAARANIDAIRTYGDPIVQELVAQGRTCVHPYDDARMMAGHRSIALENLADAPDTAVIVAGVGGGGLIGGIAVAAKALRPSMRVIGVEPEGAAGTTRALAAGSPVRLGEVRTVAVGLCAPIAAASVGALLAGRVKVRADEHVVAMLWGGNADLAPFAEWLR